MIGLQLAKRGGKTAIWKSAKSHNNACKANQNIKANGLAFS